MHGRDEKYVQNSVWGNSRVERDYLGDTGVQGKIILKWILDKYVVTIETGLI